MVGPVNGFYRLDLRINTDRLAMKLLMEKSATNAKYRKNCQLNDLSQNGDWYLVCGRYEWIIILHVSQYAYFTFFSLK